jgi:alpha-beta hydrolase superfamily lysophospholipase
VEYDPPVTDPAQLKTKRVNPSEADAKLGVQPFLLQEEPARKLKNWQGIPICLVTAEGSFALPGSPGALAYLKQAGCTAEELRLADHGIHGNGHLMMGEKNNREVLQPILDWITKNVSAKGVAIPAPRAAVKDDSTAMKLSDQGYFWVGLEQKKVEYGTILTGQTYVQYLIPQQVRHRYAVLLVHGGGGQGTHYMGVGDGHAGWAHYYVQAGFRTYILDRPGHGRPPYHPDALGPITPVLTYSTVTNDFKRAAQDPKPALDRHRRCGRSGDRSVPGGTKFGAAG